MRFLSWIKERNTYLFYLFFFSLNLRQLHWWIEWISSEIKGSIGFFVYVVIVFHSIHMNNMFVLCIQHIQTLNCKYNTVSIWIANNLFLHCDRSLKKYIEIFIFFDAWTSHVLLCPNKQIPINMLPIYAHDNIKADYSHPNTKKNFNLQINLFFRNFFLLFSSNLMWMINLIKSKIIENQSKHSI